MTVIWSMKNLKLIDYQNMIVVPRGFEPRHTESKSVVLPLYYGTKRCAKVRGMPLFTKHTFPIFKRIYWPISYPAKAELVSLISSIELLKWVKSLSIFNQPLKIKINGKC